MSRSFWFFYSTNILDHRYELYDPCTSMFFFRNKHIMIDLGTGNNNKINWAIEDKQEMIDIVETVYRGARKGRGLVVSPKDYSTKYRYWHAMYNNQLLQKITRFCIETSLDVLLIVNYQPFNFSLLHRLNPRITIPPFQFNNADLISF